MPRFDIDILSFLRVLEENDFISRDLHVGLVELGTETFYSPENITFAASDFGMNLTSNATAKVQDFPSSGADGPGRWGGRPSMGLPSAAIQLGFFWTLMLFVLALFRYL